MPERHIPLKFIHPVSKAPALEIYNANILVTNLRDHRDETAKPILTNLLTPPSQETTPASLPNPTNLISHFDELTVEQRFDLLGIDILLFGLGRSKENRQAYIQSLRKNPANINRMKDHLKLRQQDIRI